MRKIVSSVRGTACHEASAQGTTEYLVIVGIVIVIALVVVGLLISQTSNVSSVDSSSQQLVLSTQVIGVIESLVDPVDGNFVVKLLNNSGGFITMSNVKIGDNNVNFSEDLAQGGSKLFRVNTGNVCEQGKVVSDDVVVTYVTENGLPKTERYPAKIMFNCTPYTITQANLANQCPSVTFDGNASMSQVLSGYSFYSDSSTKQYGSLATQTLSDSSAHGSEGYYSAFDLNVIDSDLAPANITNGTSIFGITGTLSAGASLHSGQAISYDAGALDDKEQDGTIKSFTDNGDNTVTDNQTGLMWMKNNAGTAMNWETALSFCDVNIVGGYTDWRLPSNMEIITFGDYNCASASAGCTYKGVNIAFSATGFDSSFYGYWSSTTSPSSTDKAYFFDSYTSAIYDNTKTYAFGGARCVR